MAQNEHSAGDLRILTNEEAIKKHAALKERGRELSVRQIRYAHEREMLEKELGEVMLEVSSLGVKDLDGLRELCREYLRHNTEVLSSFEKECDEVEKQLNDIEI